MTKVQAILKEIDTLDAETKQELFIQFLKKINLMNGVLSIIDKHKGKGKGIWNKDAQEYINELRNEER